MDITNYSIVDPAIEDIKFGYSYHVRVPSTGSCALLFRFVWSY